MLLLMQLVDAVSAQAFFIYMNIVKFKTTNFDELEADAFSKYFKYQGYILEQIFVEDEREQVYLLNAYERIQKLQLPNLVQYFDVVYNKKDKCLEVLRKYYDQKFLDYPQRDKQTIINFTQQLTQTMASLEGYGVYLLGLKPTNIFVEKNTLLFSGFVRSDKFLLSSPIYQSSDLRQFIQRCISEKKYNITHRYSNKSHAMCYSAFVILIQFLLEMDTEKMANLVRWLDAGNDSLKSVPSTESLLEILEAKYDGMRLVLEQAKQLLVTELFEPTNEIGMHLLQLTSELHLLDDIILVGDRYFKKTTQQQQQPKQEIQQQQQPKLPLPKEQPASSKKSSAQTAKRTGGGFAVSKKK